jgi:DNA-binding beta-propeller fold protein YncE
VIDVNAAERGSSRAVVSSVLAGSQPVRIAVSPTGSVVWVTARASNSLLAFSAHRLKTDPARALLATVKVGTAPVGLATFDHGSRIIVADSNRFDASGAHAALTIINTRAALAHDPAVIASVPSGLFPREIAIDPRHDIALVANFGSDQLETVRLGRFR